MKKLVFMFVAVAAISFASCGNGQTQPAPAAEEVVEEAIDSVANDSLATDSVEAPADSTAAAE